MLTYFTSYNLKCPDISQFFFTFPCSYSHIRLLSKRDSSNLPSEIHQIIGREIMMATTSSTEEEEKKLSAMAERFCRRFSLAEIQLATEGFSRAHLIGEGGFGKVYKGLIDNGQLTVAIKQLAPNSKQGANEFLMEIETLSNARHVNLVSLIGYCSENGEMILVYEYIAYGTLTDHLYKPSGDNDDCLSLTWKQRLKICIGAARGLEYLHTARGSSIIHRDVKSTNILLDENFTAKVSDFGLAKHLSSSNSRGLVSTRVKGTLGYWDPSYVITGILNRKSDTYAFGVVLLEVLCGRPALDPRASEDEISLVLWAQEKISKGKVHQIVASNLRDEISADCLKTFVKVAKSCLHLEPEKRPTMSQVVVQLEFALEKQERRESTYQRSRFLPLNAFWNRIKPSGNPVIGSAENVDVNKLSTAIEEVAIKDNPTENVDVNKLSTAIEEVAIKVNPTINMLPVAIPLQELKDSTDNFSSHCLLGGESRGIIYRGVLRSGQVAAIKWLDNCWLKKEFLEQVSKLSELKHENVAQLLGYFYNDYKQFVVYEFAEKGSLHDILHGQGVEASPVLSWPQRVKIAVGAAKGLEHLHQKAQIHHDIRSRNILVFNNEVAKIAHYNPSALYQPWGSSYKILEASWRTDVYFFGVVLLQLLTNRELIDHTRPTKRQHIVTWATPYLSEDKVMKIVDARLKGQCPPKAVAEMAAIAALCVHREARKRPKMSIVVRDLCRLLDADSVQETQNL